MKQKSYLCGMIDAIRQFALAVVHAVAETTLIRLTLSKPNDPKVGLKTITGKLTALKNVPHLSLSLRYDTRHETKNFAANDLADYLLSQLGTHFLHAELLTDTELLTLLFNKKREATLLRKAKVSEKTATIASHNKEKHRLLDTGRAAVYLHSLQISTEKGEITPTGQKKYRQISKYIEIIDNLLETAQYSHTKPFTVLDMGSGKGYLTFALADYLKNIKKWQTDIIGVELRDNLVDFCNDLAKKAHFSGLSFLAQDINEVETKTGLDMLIALHACDTATDLAIAKGIKAGAKYIIVAPCCHKQIRRELEKKQGIQKNLHPLLQHGILQERQAELLTDTIRALLMEANGYKTKVFEFISSEHTAKNVMIIGEKTNTSHRITALEEIADLKTAFGIRTHALEGLL